MLSDAPTADAAIDQARAQGLIPDATEPAPAAADPVPQRRGEVGIPGWFRLGAGFALLGTCVWSAALTEVYRWLGRGDLAGIVVFLLYLAVPTGLIWSGARAIGPKKGPRPSGPDGKS